MSLCERVGWRWGTSAARLPRANDCAASGHSTATSKSLHGSNEIDCPMETACFQLHPEKLSLAGKARCPHYSPCQYQKLLLFVPVFCHSGSCSVSGRCAGLCSAAAGYAASGGCSALTRQPQRYRCHEDERCSRAGRICPFRLSTATCHRSGRMHTLTRYPWVDETKAQDASNDDLTWTDATSFCAFLVAIDKLLVGRRDGNGANQLTRCQARGGVAGSTQGTPLRVSLGPCCAGRCKYTNWTSSNSRDRMGRLRLSRQPRPTRNRCQTTSISGGFIRRYGTIHPLTLREGPCRLLKSTSRTPASLQTQCGSRLSCHEPPNNHRSDSCARPRRYLAVLYAASIRSSLVCVLPHVQTVGTVGRPAQSSLRGFSFSRGTPLDHGTDVCSERQPGASRV